MRARQWLALVLSHLVFAAIVVAVWAERSEIADHLRDRDHQHPTICPPPKPINRNIRNGGEIPPIAPELDTVHLADFGVPPSTRVEPKLLNPEPHMRLSETVVLEVTVGKDGTVEQIKLISGHPMLISAAIDAVKQWSWKPFRLNGRPLRVISNIAVPFPPPR
ncbi:MAG TPA: energy transducer TonB [Terriglobales bacterium]|nr:energy transducer TonB [Terriglobales bacterium]